MDFARTSEQDDLAKATTAFCRDHINTVAVGDPSEFPREKWRLCADYGLLGLLVPAEYGGLGHDCVTSAIILEAFGHTCSDYGLVHGAVTQLLTAHQIATYGSEEQKKSYLPRACKGECIFAQAMTEPDAGSATSDIQTLAAHRDGSYWISGSKVLISNAPVADVVLVFAVTDPDGSFLQKTSCFVVEADRPGVTKGQPLEKMGLESLQNGELFFDDYEAAESDLLGRKGGGNAIFADAMTWERILLFATHVGKLRQLLEESVEYAKVRRQFGQPIGKFQAVAHKIADMRVDLELATLILHKAAWMKDRGKRATLESSIAKLFISERAREAALAAVQIHGGYGYMKEYEVEQALRDTVAGTLYSGTSEIQKNIIAKFCGL